MSLREFAAEHMKERWVNSGTATQTRQSFGRSVEPDGGCCANSSSYTQVEEVVTGEERAQEIEVKHPPKVSKRE